MGEGVAHSEVGPGEELCLTGGAQSRRHRPPRWVTAGPPPPGAGRRAACHESDPWW